MYTVTICDLWLYTLYVYLLIWCYELFMFHAYRILAVFLVSLSLLVKDDLWFVPRRSFSLHAGFFSLSLISFCLSSLRTGSPTGLRPDGAAATAAGRGCSRLPSSRATPPTGTPSLLRSFVGLSLVGGVTHPLGWAQLRGLLSAGEEIAEFAEQLWDSAFSELFSPAWYRGQWPELLIQSAFDSHFRFSLLSWC